jgi:hypothetical protein
MSGKRLWLAGGAGIRGHGSGGAAKSGPFCRLKSPKKHRQSRMLFGRKGGKSGLRVVARNDVA